ncbi:hypothetical protein E7Z53_17320 [Kocuria salina]|uniref:hypothetical protein n=1 Tax=Kocuria salina TaxID=1929416 RepID=UPI001592B1AF|nr:hypothetical protein [Kocuria salina]NVC25186.1 hypothetical protein [Kocuria salina]
MDDRPRPAPDESSPVDTAPVPTVGQVVVGTAPAAAVLVVAMPVALWWLLDTSSGELRTPWRPALLLGLLALFHLLARLARPPRPTGLPSVSAERVRNALVSAARTGAVPSEPRVRAAAAATACQRVEAAAYAVAATTGVLIASLLVPQPAWTVFAVVAGILALIHVLRARHPWAYLRAVHHDDHAN